MTYQCIATHVYSVWCRHHLFLLSCSCIAHVTFSHLMSSLHFVAVSKWKWPFEMHWKKCRNRRHSYPTTIFGFHFLFVLHWKTKQNHSFECYDRNKRNYGWFTAYQTVDVAAIVAQYTLSPLCSAFSGDFQSLFVNKTRYTINVIAKRAEKKYGGSNVNIELYTDVYTSYTHTHIWFQIAFRGKQ